MANLTVETTKAPEFDLNNPDQIFEALNVYARKYISRPLIHSGDGRLDMEVQLGANKFVNKVSIVCGSNPANLAGDTKMPIIRKGLTISVNDGSGKIVYGENGERRVQPYGKWRWANYEDSASVTTFSTDSDGVVTAVTTETHRFSPSLTLLTEPTDQLRRSKALYPDQAELQHIAIMGVKEALDQLAKATATAETKEV